jgi:phospholipid/cholesterol/gamma-HCH transport system substrate-binding protein
MTPTPTRHAVIVGLFVAVAVAILAGAILMIGNLNDAFAPKDSISAVFDQVSGLKQGDAVWYSGLKVGRVTKLRFQDGSQVSVWMRVDRAAMQFIHEDATAKVGSDNIIGNRIVVLSGGTPDAPTLLAGDVLKSSKAVSSDEIMSMLQENNANLLAITTNLKGVSDGLAHGEGSLGKLLADDVLYGKLEDAVATLDTAATNASSLTSSLSDFAAKLNRPGTLPDDIVNDRTTYASLTSAVGELQHASRRASGLMDGLAGGAADPNTPIGTLVLDEKAGADLKETIENLSRGSKLLAEDLEAAQHNILLRGFFRKKEKEAEKSEAEKSETEKAPGESVLSAAVGR